MKELITANTISDARKAGVKHIYVTSGALITPQARDDAKQYGIALLMQEQPAPNVAPTYTTQAPVMVNTIPAQNHFPAYATTQQHRVVMNSPNSPSHMDPIMQQLVDQVLKAVSPAQNPAPAPSWSVNTCPAQGQAINPAAITAQVVQQVNTLLAARGGIAAFPGLDATIAAIVAEFTQQCSGFTQAPAVSMPSAMPASMPSSSIPSSSMASCAQGTMAGVDVVPFSAQQPAGRVQGEVTIEEALLPGQNGPGVTRFTFTDTSLVWTFTHQEVLVVTHGSIEVQGAGSTCMLTQGSAIRVASGTSVTLVAHGAASCVCTTWPK